MTLQNRRIIWTSATQTITFTARQLGTTLIIGLVILLILTTATTMGFQRVIVNEKIASNFQKQAQARKAAENTIATTLANNDVIHPALLKVKNGHTLLNEPVAAPTGNAHLSADATLDAKLVPTYGYSLGVLRTYSVAITAETQNVNARANVRQGFARLAPGDS